MSEQVTPGDNIRELIERVSHYLEVRQSVTPMADTFTTIHDIDMGSGGHIRLTTDDVSVLLSLARRVSPVTREALEETVSKMREFRALYLEVDASIVDDVKRGVVDTILPLLSVSPPAEVTDEMVERLARALHARTQEGRSGVTWPVNGEIDRSRDMADARKLLERVLGVPVSPERGESNV